MCLPDAQSLGTNEIDSFEAYFCKTIPGRSDEIRLCSGAMKLGIAYRLPCERFDYDSSHSNSENSQHSFHHGFPKTARFSCRKMSTITDGDW